MVEFGLSSNTIQSILETFKVYTQIEKAILYGSRAMGNYREGSDIDLTLIGEGLNLTILQAIENDLDELLLPYKIDISLYKQISNPDLLKHIDTVGVVFYQKSKT
ncbi:nucleotidyltransferase domain-containing protein [Belliella pelovolcani]|uniref:Nucleotidyltransferase domain-containing protein n=1 Tax=Belliella pelovolcani TaxID=529505 RepID=A0A1N7P232_9BACT|nr:nucleotidyltransferase domain-containing protein [Belliella pelovolcani]SIT04618.1 Nucleotidyltransferase domain-containing protein [Belliella pelovolcani]